MQLFSLPDCSVCLVVGVGVSCPGQFILTPTHLGIKVKECLYTYFKLSECEDVNNKHNSSQMQLFSLPDCSVCLVSG